MTILSSLFETVGEQLDGIIDSYRREKPNDLTKTKIYYNFNPVEIVELDIVNMIESDLDRTKTLTKIEFGTHLETIGITFGQQEFLSELTFHGKTIAQVKAMSGYSSKWGLNLCQPTIYCEDGSIPWPWGGSGGSTPGKT